MKVVLSMEDVCRLSKWSVGVNLITAGLTRIWPPSFVADCIGFRTLVSLPGLSTSVVTAVIMSTSMPPLSSYQPP